VLAVSEMRRPALFIQSSARARRTQRVARAADEDEVGEMMLTMEAPESSTPGVVPQKQAARSRDQLQSVGRRSCSWEDIPQYGAAWTGCAG